MRMTVEQIRAGVTRCRGESAHTASWCESFGCDQIATLLEVLDARTARLRHLATTIHNAHGPVALEACPAAVCRENVAALGGEL